MSKFLDRAIKQKGSTLETVLSGTNYRKRNQKEYFAGLQQFAIRTQKVDMSQFTDLVRTINKDLNIKTGAADLKTFKKYVKENDLKRMYLSDFNVKFKRNKFTQKEAEQLYVVYWTDKIMHEYNKKINESKSMHKKYKKDAFIAPYASLFQSHNPEDTTLKDYKDFSDQILKRWESLQITSEAKAYKKPTQMQFKKFKEAFLKGEKRGLDYFKNYQMLDLNNIIRALRKENWNDALELVEELINQGQYNKILSAFTASGITVKYIYDDETIDSTESKLIRFLEA